MHEYYLQCVHPSGHSFFHSEILNFTVASKPSVYDFGQFRIKQISSAFLLLSLLNRFLTLNLLLFCCNCFSSCLICIVKARLQVFVYADFFCWHFHCAQIFIFSINFLEFFKNNLKSKHKTEYDISLQQQLLSLVFHVIFKLIKMASCATAADEDNVRNLIQRVVRYGQIAIYYQSLHPNATGMSSASTRNQCITVRSSLSFSIHLYTCCTFSIYPKHISILYFPKQRAILLVCKTDAMG